jgi:hypothetical protein
LPFRGRCACPRSLFLGGGGRERRAGESRRRRRRRRRRREEEEEEEGRGRRASTRFACAFLADTARMRTASV